MNSLDYVTLTPPDDPPSALAQFVDEVMDLLGAFVLHLEGEEQESPAAARAFREHPQVTLLDLRQAENEISEFENRAVQSLREAYDLRDRANRRELKGVLERLDGRHLEEAGLAGPELELKLLTFRRWLSEFLFGGGRFLRPGTKTALRKALERANIVLGSLGGVPGVSAAVEPIKELKESVEACYS